MQTASPAIRVEDRVGSVRADRGSRYFRERDSLFKPVRLMVVIDGDFQPSRREVIAYLAPIEAGMSREDECAAKNEYQRAYRNNPMTDTDPEPMFSTLGFCRRCECERHDSKCTHDGSHER